MIDSDVKSSAGARPTPEVCVGAIVVERDRLLLVERGRGAAVGQWSIPGGRVESGESLAAAVEREVQEETGLSVECGDFLGWVERISGDHHFVIMDFLAELSAESSAGPSEPVAGDDAAAAAWVGLDELNGVELVAGLQEFLDQHGVTTDHR